MIYHFFFLGYFLALFSKDCLIYYLSDNYKYKSGQLYGMYIYFFSHLLSFIPYFISKCLLKRKIKVDTINSDETYIYNDIITQYEDKYFFKQILIVSLFIFFSEVERIASSSSGNNLQYARSFFLSSILMEAKICSKGFS